MLLDARTPEFSTTWSENLNGHSERETASSWATETAADGLLQLHLTHRVPLHPPNEL